MQFNSFISNLKFKNPFSIMHLNIRSLRAKIDHLHAYIKLLQACFSVIALTETWLNDESSSSYSLPGYTFVCANRQNRKGGGVAMFIRSDLTFTFRNKLQSCDDDLETVFIEIHNDSGKNLLVGTIYRPPGNTVLQSVDKLSA